MLSARHAAVIIGGLLLSACGNASGPPDFVARVGNSYLSQEDLDQALIRVPVGLDSADAADQFIERWITDELLAREARTRNLEKSPDVRRRMVESERAILIGTLVGRMYSEVEAPSEREIRSYFDRNIENLALRETFLRIRYLSTTDSAAAVLAVAVLDTLDRSVQSDSTWRSIIAASAADPEAALALSTNYFPEGRLFRNIPELATQVSRLRPGQESGIIQLNDLFHVIQLVDRVPAGTTPQIDWVMDDIRNRLLIDKRKQLHYDQVQRLRNSALASGELELRSDGRSN